ncbi:MAG: hypothetical protein IKO05_00195 [Selenomonadaceae bacterium]|nr:hypothetical protein [Selenomonadaceae bacterium]
MKKKLHDEFSEIIFKKLDEWKNVGNEGFHVNLIDAFWLMHLDFEHFMNHLRPTPTDKKRNASAFREDIAAIKAKIIEHYSKLFETDFQNYTENFLDGIYSDIFFDRNKIFEKLPDLSNVDAESSLPPELLSKIVALAGEIKSLVKAVEDFQSKHGQALQINKPVLSLSGIKKLKVSLTDAKLNWIQTISDRTIRLQAQIKALTLNCNESEFNAAIKSCDERTDRNGELSNCLKKYLTLLYYLIDGSFNHEIILVFLFGKVDWSKAGKYLKFVVERHEKFFLSIYNELKAFYPHTDALLDIGTNICPRAVTSKYYHPLPEFSPLDEPRAILFKLKKLINLYEFYCKAQKISPLKCVRAAMNVYKNILVETRFTEFHYAPMWSDLPSYIMNLFGLNQSDLAKILGIGNHNVTREKAKGTLIENYDWFWQAATGFTYTYVLGETTIPFYGKMNSDSARYTVLPVSVMAYAEMFLNYIDVLTDYRKKIKANPDISKSKFSLNEERTKNLSEKVQILMNAIQEKRLFLNEFQNQRENFNVPVKMIQQICEKQKIYCKII